MVGITTQGRVEMRVGSLFSGGGLGDLGFVMAGCEIVFQVEIDEYCQKILELRYPDAKKFRDIRSVKGTDLPMCDILTGGFPCQPHSNIGHRKGSSDERDLWPEMLRVIRELKPRYIVGENVSGVKGTILDEILDSLEMLGYEAWTFIFPAHSLGSPHLRERLWIVAHAKSDKSNGIQRETKSINAEWNTRLESKCDALASGRNFWATEPRMGRVANGVANRVERLKLLGNGQVPYCTKWIAERIMEFDTFTERNGVLS
jgi:DNA (cytosine-5)-methyltransferase 1